MKHPYGRCLILVALLLMTSAFPLATATEGEPLLKDLFVQDEYFADFDDAITELTERWSIPGSQVAVMFNGTLVFYNGYGVADSDSATNVTAD